MAIILYFLTPLLINVFYYCLISIVGLAITNNLTQYYLLHFFVISLLLVLFINVFTLSKLFTNLIIIIKQIRNITYQELQIIQPLLVNLISKINQLYNTNYQINDFIIKILPNKELDYFTLGNNVIVISDGVFNLLDKNQQEAVLSTMLATLYLKYGLKNNFMLFNITLIDIAMFFAKHLWQLFKYTYKTISKLSKIIYIIFLVPFFTLCIILLPFCIITWFCNSLIKIVQIIFNGLVYNNADRFSVSIGCKYQLISLLEFSNLNYVTNKNNFIINYFKNYYSPTSRINKIN